MALISKKLGQFKQWTGEVFGSTERTEASEEFKQLQMATETRKEGIENIHGSLAGYATTLDGKDPDKKLPTISTADKKTPCLTGLGKALVQQGRLQGEDNSYGCALLRVGEAQQELSNNQIELVSKMRQGFLFDVSEMLAGVKEFEHLKKKLENRRLDYDAKQNKLSKSKKEKPALEEEARACQYKYEETYNDLLALMSRFGEREEALLPSLVEFAQIQAEFFAKGHEITQKMISVLKEAGFEAKPRNYGLMKTSSFTESVRKPSFTNGNGSSAKIPTSQEIKQIAAPTAISNEPSNSVGNGGATTTTPKPKEAAVAAPLYRVRALYAFKAEGDDDLGFAKGEIINVVGEVDENWSTGEIQEDDGSIRKGIFPSNYVEKLTNLPKEPGARVEEAVNGAATAAVAGLSQEAMSQMKSVLPSGNLSDITAAITNVKLKSSGSRQSSVAKHAEAPAKQEVAAVGACSTCGCDDFHPNAFKKGHCNMCFHPH